MNPPATGLTGAFNQTYLSGLQTIVSYITGKGAFVLIERKLQFPLDSNSISN
jgi:endoglucanase